ncbi:25.3 kDa heat shock protein [Acrasis kona]|uniref:25.3 kDa heat shock protein n=1 Tax=Acrasis kona TaxID=1008807 RepID=A0AAW2ZCZ9_9EUKA
MNIRDFEDHFNAGLMRMFQDPFNGRTRMSHDQDGLKIRAEVPGFSSDDIKITLEDNRLLCFAGELKNENEGKERNDKSYNSFRQCVNLPRDSNLDQINAKVEHGVLNIEVPKTQRESKSFVDIPIRKD